MPKTPAKSREIKVTIRNPNLNPANGMPPRFMPNKLATRVGAEIITVIEVSTFITILRLFEITEAKASIVPDSISL